MERDKTSFRLYNSISTKNTREHQDQNTITINQSINQPTTNPTTPFQPLHNHYHHIQLRDPLPIASFHQSSSYPPPCHASHPSREFMLLGIITAQDLPPSVRLCRLNLYLGDNPSPFSLFFSSKTHSLTKDPVIHYRLTSELTHRRRRRSRDR